MDNLKKTLQKRTIGQDIYLEKRLQDLSEQEINEQIIEQLWVHGVICLKSQNLEPKDLVELAKKIGESFQLPEVFSFENRDDDHPEIVRIGNIQKNGEIIQNCKAAEYWHHDGDFWPAPQNQIINILHSKILPQKGGKTGFFDTVKPYYQQFDQETVEKLDNSTILVSTKNISDFKNAPAEQHLPEVIHDVVKTHPVNKIKGLYLPFNSDGIKNKKTEKNWTSNEEIWQQIIDGGHFYEHQWEEGDILLWDNLQVMHRSMGGYGNNPRLLYRVQVRYESSTNEIEQEKQQQNNNQELINQQ